MRTIYNSVNSENPNKSQSVTTGFSSSVSSEENDTPCSYTETTSLYDPKSLESQTEDHGVTTATYQGLTPKSQELNTLTERSEAAMKLVDDIVLKNYLIKLSDLDIVPMHTCETKDVILYKINKMVYEKDEYATDKFISVISAMTYTNCSIFMIVDGHDSHTDFYLGIKSKDESRGSSSIGETLCNSLKGQFPGVKIENYSIVAKGKEKALQDKLFHKISEATCISSCVGVPSYKNSKGEYTNANFIQGIEKFASAMQGKRYTTIILASNVPQGEILQIRNSYENIYADLSAMSTRQFAYSTNESLSNAFSRSRGYSDTDTYSTTKGSSDSVNKAHTHTEGTSESNTKTKGTTKDNFWGKAGKIAGPLMETGAILTATGVAAPLGFAVMGVGAVAGIGNFFAGGQKSKSKSETKGTHKSDGYTEGTAHSDSYNETKGRSHTENFSETDGKTSTVGQTKNFTVTIQNKYIQDVLKRIDTQLERVEICESTGLWSAGAYFLSYGLDHATAEIGASIFRSIMQGEQSGVECSAINTWNDNDKEQFKSLVNYLTSFSHPVFEYPLYQTNSVMEILPTSMLSSKELAILMGLPRKSVPGFPVIEHISLGKEVVKLTNGEEGYSFDLGCIFDQGVERVQNPVSLNVNSLTQHTFVTGSTGCGKSETVYKLIDSVRKVNVKTLIIEPAKGEYKNVFGTDYIFGTNPLKSNLLKINPFRFHEGVHVLEHADRLIEIFNVCWPMYAAMPAVLKEAVLNAYEDCGWDLVKSTNKYSDKIFPTFSDLIWELETVIELSDYSEEVKSNYKGSLVTRVKSLANGINGEIFSGQEIGDHILFDENVVVDISRIGSQETKALIMGILIMRLSEYRSNSGLKTNSSLRHITVLEEAHNLLKRCSQEQNMEGSNLVGKSVEMISNAIAEMRTYGEGFIIVDQSPGAVDISAIRNTNTKIIMRLPEESDRKISGKSAAMRDSEIDEIAKLPTGVAVVYQNNWEEPVLCKVEKYNGKRLEYEFKEDKQGTISLNRLILEILKFMFRTKVLHPEAADLVFIEENLSKSTLPTYVKIHVLESINEYKGSGSVSIWSNEEFVKFSWVISGLLGLKPQIIKLAKQPYEFEQLTLALKSLLRNRVKDIPVEYEMAIIQSLLRDYSTGSEARLRRYSDWLRSAREMKK